MDNLDGPFDLTPNGYQQAISWLARNGHAAEIDHESKPMDSYSVVTLANDLSDKRRGNNGALRCQ